jgi:dipeptidyl aminopeptidase/acylaminoacyl peptidase
VTDPSRRLNPDDLFVLQHLRGACLAPDARRVAYAVSHTDSSEHVGIWIADVASGAKRRLAHPGIAHAPSWSRDGNRIAFVCDGRLCVADARTLDACEPLTPSGQTVEGRPSWSPDGRRIVVSLREHRTIDEPRRIDSTHFRVDGIGFIDHFTQRIAVVDVADRSVRHLTDAAEICTQPEWSPCGRRVLFLVREAVIPFETNSQCLRVVAADSDSSIELLDSNWFVDAARWSPSGERIVVSAAADRSLTAPTLALWSINPANGQRELRMACATSHIGFRLNHDMPSRELAAAYGLVVPSEEVAFVTIQKGGSTEIWRASLRGDISTTPVVHGDRACIALDANMKADALVFAATDVHRPFELMLASLDGQREHRLTQLNDDTLRNWPANDLERFRFESHDGLPLDAWFMSAAGSRRPAPTVLFIHAGPYLCTGNAFRYDFHLLTSHGFGVLFANFRGSAGYGEGFMRAIRGDWGALAYPDHMAVVDAAIERCYADPAKLGVWGPSHGGFATCWIVGHTNRFRAALAEAATANFATLYYQTDAPRTYCRELGGRPHEIPNVYRSRSPLTYAHRCSTPTLLVHGEDDLRCPIGEAEQFHRALRDAGCHAELLRVPGCSHLGDSIGPLSARLAQNEALVHWFGRYLK